MLFSCAPPTPASAQDKPAAAASAPRLDIDLGENTSLADAAHHLAGRFRTAGQNVNLIVKGDGTKIPVPPISLQSVTFEQAVQAVALLVNPPLAVQGDAGMLVIYADASVLPGKNKLRVFNVSSFLGQPGTKEADERFKQRLVGLNAAIEKGIVISRKSSTTLQQPDLELDQGTGLLFASGSPEALEIVTEVVAALCENRSAAASQAKP